FDFVHVANAERGDFYPQIHRRGLCGPQKPRMGRCLWMQNDCHALYRWCDFFKRLQPFAPYLGFEIGKPGDVASWMRETFDEARPDRVRNLQEQDRLTGRCVTDRL